MITSPKIFFAALFSLALAACATVPPAARGPASAPTPPAAWANVTPLLAHYHLAIVDDDVERMRAWLAAGFSADARVSMVHPSAIQLAIATHRREIIRMMIDNPRVEARPDPRRWVDLCPATRDHLRVSLYEYIVFEDANASYARTCRDDDYYAARDRALENLGVTDDTVATFTGVALNESSPELFRAETKVIRSALKTARATTGRDAPNDRLLSFIENY